MASISHPVISTPTLPLVALTSAVYNQLIAVESHRQRTGTGRHVQREGHTLS